MTHPGGSDMGRPTTVDAYAIHRPSEGSLATPGMAAFMTWKQAELVVILGENGAMSIADLGDLIREIHAIDLAAGNRPMYWGVDNQAIRACIAGIARRGLVRQMPDERWVLTPRGRDAADVVR